jgi:hypothetical protein
MAMPGISCGERIRCGHHHERQFIPPPAREIGSNISNSSYQILMTKAEETTVCFSYYRVQSAFTDVTYGLTDLVTAEVQWSPATPYMPALRYRKRLFFSSLGRNALPHGVVLHKR